MPLDPFPIHTSRLTLRRFEAKDLPAFVAYRSDPEVARFQSWSSLNEAEALDFIREQQQSPFGVPGEWFQIALAQQQTDALIGDIGVCLKGAEPTAAEIGFSLSQENQGKGLASEAVRAVLVLLFEAVEVERIEAITDSRNIASIALLRRIGLRLDRTDPTWFKGSPCIEHTFVLGKRDWLSSPLI